MKRLARVKLLLPIIHLFVVSSIYAASPNTAEWQRYVVSKPQVVFPAVLRRTGMQGRGIYLLSIDPKTGIVSEVKVIKSTGYQQLDALFVMNFFQWKFQPGTITSAQIPRWYHITGRRYILH
jgi:outer membrane biosynthesis protein TonB